MNIVLSLIENERSVEEIEKLASFAKENNHSLLLLSQKQNKTYATLREKKNFITCHLFPNGTLEESMIESAFMRISGPTLLIRDNFEIPELFLIKKFLGSHQNGAEIVCIRKRKKKNKFWQKVKDFFHNTMEKLVGFNFYRGDVGMQLFGESAMQTMQATNVGTLSKINRWLAFEIAYIDEDYEQKKYKPKELKKTYANLVAFSVCAVVLLATPIIVNIFTNLSFILWLAGIVLSLMSFTLAILNLAKIISLKKIGIISYPQEYPIAIEEI